MRHIVRLVKYAVLDASTTAQPSCMGISFRKVTVTRRCNYCTEHIPYRFSPRRSILEITGTDNHTAKIIFNDGSAYDFKYIWLRDNCTCPACVHEITKQKLLDTPNLDVNVRPAKVSLDNMSNMTVHWPETASHPSHVSTYSADWLQKHGKCLSNDSIQASPLVARPAIKLWDGTVISSELPEITYKEMMTTDEGLFQWLDMLHKYGLAFLRDVPLRKGEIRKVVERFAYVKQTGYGITFDVKDQPEPGAHLAVPGLAVAHHTDMNYRGKSPGMQVLHCLRADYNVQTKASVPSVGGESFFVDGFAVAEWLKEKQPLAFHVLCSTDVKFRICSFISERYKEYRCSQQMPIICTDKAGHVKEIHVNNRTMAPLHAPPNIVLPFYHAYKILSNKIREEKQEIRTCLRAGDLVMFNNRRILHGRTAFDPVKLRRQLIGCYVDLGEVMSKYDSFMLNR